MSGRGGVLPARWLACLVGAALLAPVGTALASGGQPAHKPRARDSGGTSDDAKVLASEAVHIVRPGETLGGIAERAQVPRVVIIEANGLKAPYSVKTGQKLLLPRTRHHVVKAGESGFDVAYRYGVPFKSIAVANGLKPNAVLQPGQRLLIPTILNSDAADKTPAPSPAPSASPPASALNDDAGTDTRAAPTRFDARFDWPLLGKLRRGFVARTEEHYHDGIDIAGAEGSAVRAARAGTVIFAGKEPESFGNLVVLEGTDGWRTAYGFLSKVTVARGDEVRAHERIGLVGHTGQAKGDELHFEIRQRGNKPVDPLDYLPKRPGAEPARAADAQGDGPARSRPKAKPTGKASRQTGLSE